LTRPATLLSFPVERVQLIVRLVGWQGKPLLIKDKTAGRPLAGSSAPLGVASLVGQLAAGETRPGLLCLAGQKWLAQSDSNTRGNAHAEGASATSRHRDPAESRQDNVDGCFIPTQPVNLKLLLSDTRDTNMREMARFDHANHATQTSGSAETMGQSCSMKGSNCDKRSNEDGGASSPPTCFSSIASTLAVGVGWMVMALAR